MLKKIIDFFLSLLGGDEPPPKIEVPEVEDDSPKTEEEDPPEPPEPPEVDPLAAEKETAGDYAEDLDREPHLKTSEQWGLGDVEPVLKRDDSGPKVKEFQGWLEKLGYELTRHGVDGHLGQETLQETADFQDDDREKGGDLKKLEHALKINGVGPKTYEAIKKEADLLPIAPPPTMGEPTKDFSDSTPDDFYDVRIGGKGVKQKRKREDGWHSIKGITLHQTACELGTKPSRYKKVSAHIGIARDGKIIQMNPLDWVVYHGNGFNNKDVGIEIDGHFAGIEGDIKTYWRPKSDPDRKPLSVTDAQIDATLEAIEWIIAQVQEHGGKVEFLHAHRQSSTSRTSDPGSKVWRTIALVAKKKWGLKDGGPDFKAGGYTIPKPWDPAYTGKYRQ